MSSLHPIEQIIQSLENKLVDLYCTINDPNHEPSIATLKPPLINNKSLKPKSPKGRAIDKESFDDWAAMMRAQFAAIQCSIKSLSDIHMIVLASMGVENVDIHLLPVAEEGVHAGGHSLTQIVNKKFAQAQKEEVASRDGNQIPASSFESKKISESKGHILFLNVCFSENTHAWVNVLCSIKFINEILHQVTDTKIVILDLRDDMHIHKKDYMPQLINPNQNEPDLCQHHPLFKVKYAKTRHCFLSKTVKNDRSLLYNELSNLFNTGNFSINLFDLPKVEAANEQPEPMKEKIQSISATETELGSTYCIQEFQNEHVLKADQEFLNSQLPKPMKEESQIISASETELKSTYYIQEFQSKPLLKIDQEFQNSPVPELEQESTDQSQLLLQPKSVLLLLEDSRSLPESGVLEPKAVEQSPCVSNPKLELDEESYNPSQPKYIKKSQRVLKLEPELNESHNLPKPQHESTRESQSMFKSSASESDSESVYESDFEIVEEDPLHKVDVRKLISVDRNINTTTCKMSFMKFSEERKSKRFPIEMAYIELRLLLTLSLRFRWLVNQVEFHNVDYKNSFVKKIRANWKPSAHYSNLFSCDYSGTGFVRILIPWTEDMFDNYYDYDKFSEYENIVLVFCDATERLQQFTKEYSEYIRYSQPVNRFMDISIEYDKNPQAYRMHQEHRIAHIIKRYNIDTVEADKHPRKKPFSFTKHMREKLDATKYIKTDQPVVVLLEDLNKLKQTRPDISGAVNILLTYQNKPSEYLWKCACDVALYLHCNKWWELKLEPTGAIKARSDGSGNHNAPKNSDTDSNNGAQPTKQQKAQQHQDKNGTPNMTPGTSNQNAPKSSDNGSNNRVNQTKHKKAQRHKGQNGKLNLTPETLNQNSEEQREKVESTDEPVKVSQSGYILTYNDSPIIWRSEHLNLEGVSDVYTEIVELYGAACAAVDACLIESMLNEFGIVNDYQVKIYVDSAVALALVDERYKARHLADGIKPITRKDDKGNEIELVQCDNFLRTLVYLRKPKAISCVELTKVRSGNNEADLFTKLDHTWNHEDVCERLYMIRRK